MQIGFHSHDRNTSIDYNRIIVCAGGVTNTPTSLIGVVTSYATKTDVTNTPTSYITLRMPFFNRCCCYCKQIRCVNLNYQPYNGLKQQFKQCCATKTDVTNTPTSYATLGMPCFNRCCYGKQIRCVNLNYQLYNGSKQCRKIH